MMRIDIVSVQPQMFRGFLEESIVARAVKKGACEIRIVDLRDFGEGKWKKVDDKPYGGGPGMLMKCGPWFAAVEACVGERGTGEGELRVENGELRVGEGELRVEKEEGSRGDEKRRIVMTDPKGKTFTQRDAEALASCDHLVFMCGHYEGFDARIETLATDRYSLGDFVMTGGELAAAAMTDAIVRLLPGVLGGGAQATSSESFSHGGILEAPQYTHPPEFRGMKVPEVLLSGDHAKIEAWKKSEAHRLTAQRRPDLLA
ncbi:MAG: tRNA (guanosine(37)-N1)-methyltransferase TrmD [Kiritimatiellae bacterium]|nr:tRNA (guanosine(37)-N1)-methyltransferase TrmD [Kiritimatiellia bacterium]